MAGTRADLVAQVYDRLGVPTTDPQITAAVVQRLVNDALHEYEVEHDWPWLQASETLTTANGTDTYSLAANWRRTVSLRISDDWSLDRYGLQDLFDSFSDNTRGRPEAYTIWADQVILRATPDAVYSVKHRYMKKEADLSADGSAPFLPLEYQGCVVEKAASTALRRLRDEQRAASAEAAYQRWLVKMRDDTRRSRGNGHVRVRPGID